MGQGWIRIMMEAFYTTEEWAISKFTKENVAQRQNIWILRSCEIY
jgi:hypothetical protein